VHGPWVTLVLPAVLAGLVAILVTVAIERLGGLVGGILATLPSTIVPASLGMYAELDTPGLRAALCMVPMGMLLNAGFLWLWRALPPRLPAGSRTAQLTGMVVASLSVWCAGAMLLVVGAERALHTGFEPLALGTGGLALLLAFGGLACRVGVPAPRGRNRVSAMALLVRGGLAASAVAIALGIAALGQPLMAGAASVFPSIFLTAMVSLWWSQGRAVSGGAVGPMMLGSASVAAYAVLAAVALPALGAVAGVLLSWSVAVGGVSVPAALWLRSRRPVRSV